MTVPEGHEVRLFGRTIEPFIGRMPGGLLVASTGCGGDDQESEVASMLVGLAAQVKPCAVIINAEIVRLDELFAPRLPPTQTAESAAVVYFQKGSLAGCTDKALAGITDRLRDLGRRTTLFVGLDPAHDESRVQAVGHGVPGRRLRRRADRSVQPALPQAADYRRLVARDASVRSRRQAHRSEATA